MKKLLIIILFLFLLCGCSKKDDVLIGVSRINESVICEEYCTLDLKIISTGSLESIKLENLNVNTNYDYTVEKSKKEIKIAEDFEKKIYSYDLSIKLFAPANITSVDLIIDQENYTFNIGSFKCLEKDNETFEHLKCYSTKSSDLTKGTVNHKLNILNKTTKPVMITDISLKTNDEDIRVCKNLKTKIIDSNEKVVMANSFVYIDEALYNLNYFLEISYIYEGNSYKTYFRINDTSMVETVSSGGSSIVVDKSCFVLSE